MLLFAACGREKFMTMASEGNKMTGRAGSNAVENVTCPFCGILCDDLEIMPTEGGLKVSKNACSLARAGFERPVGDPTPRIDGKPVSLAEAIKATATRIKAAALPLYGGLATDVEGMRSIMALAEKTGGVVDHALSEGQYRNFKVLQTSGWFMSTLTEVRNRADLIIVVGTDVHKIHPRFFERVGANPNSMFSEPANKRTIIFLGEGLDTSAATGSRIDEVITVPCPPARVGEVVAAVRAIVNGRPMGAETVAGASAAQLRDVAERCKKAAYGVMVWAPPGLAFENADLTVHAVSELVKDLNLTTRFAGLSLGGNEGAVTAGAVCGWQSGYPLRVSFATGKPDYDALRYSIGRMLTAGEGDLLVWIASISPTIVPQPTKLPTVVLGTPDLKLTAPPNVFIPVGSPGLDHDGRLVRCDNVVTLPLRNLHRAPLPSVADTVAAIQAAL
jgi:formylmethanofuran dehydrogenase subunit B